MAESIIKNEYLELHEAITEIFEDEIKVSINKQEMHDYIVDYIGYFDVIEAINVYQFLDRYHLSHNFFNMAFISSSNISVIASCSSKYSFLMIDSANSKGDSVISTNTLKYS